MSLLVMIMFLLAICPSLFPQVFAYFLAQQDVSGIFCTFCVLVLEAVISVRTPASFWLGVLFRNQALCSGCALAIIVGQENFSLLPFWVLWLLY